MPRGSNRGGSRGRGSSNNGRGRGGSRGRGASFGKRTSSHMNDEDEIWTAADKHSGLNVYDDSTSSSNYSKARGGGGGVRKGGAGGRERKEYDEDAEFGEEDVAPVLIGADNDFEDEDDEEEEDDDEDEDDADEDDADEEEIPRSTGAFKSSSSSSSSKPSVTPSVDDIDRQLSAWGRKKSTYYNNDADVEIDDEAAKAEEIEAIRLQRQRAADLDDGDDDDDNGVFSFPALAEAKKQQKLAEEANAKSTIKGKGSKVTSSSSSSRLHTIEAQPKDMRQLSRQDKLRLIMSEAPELIGLLEDMAIKAKEMKEKISPALEEAKKRNRESENEGTGTLTVTSTKKEAQGDSVLQYLQVRNQLLLTYVIDITFVMLLKAEGRSIRDHPVIAQLVQIQTILEKMKNLDVKMQPHINRLLQAARTKRLSSSDIKGKKKDEEDEEQEEDDVEVDYSDVKNHPRAIQVKVGKAALLRASSSTSISRPNPHAPLAHGSDLPAFGDDKKTNEKLKKSKKSRDFDEEEEDEEEIEKDDKEEDVKGGLYRPLRRSAVEFDGDKSSKAAKAEKDRLRAMKRLSKSALLADIKQAYGDAPEQDDFTGTQSEAYARKAADEALDKIQAERTAYEEDTHTRVGMSKAEKKMRKARAREVERWDSLAELEQFGDLDVLTKKLDDADVSGKTLSRKSSGMGGISSSKADLAASRSARGVERSASAAVGSKRSRGPDDADEDDEIDNNHRPLGLSKQRKSFRSSNDDDDDDDDDDDEGHMGMGEEEDPLYTALAQAAAHKKAKKVAQREAEKDATSEYVRERADEFLDEGTARGPHGKRSVSREIMKNRGLTKYRSKIERNPRVHNRVKAAKFAMRRKGQVVSMRDPSEGDRYGGEVTGIRTNVIKSRKISS